MSALDWDAEAARQQLERILVSRGFARNQRLSAFLRFIVERHLEGGDGELKESVLGTEVFGREPDYNPKRDPIVRTEARRLRSRLGEYYANGGRSDAIVIEVPKGGYVPVISVRAATGELKPSERRRWRIAIVAVILMLLGYSGPPAKASREVYDLFRRARALEMQPGLRGAETSIDLFERATAKDPSFVPGYAGAAAGYAAVSAFDRFTVQERADQIARGWAAGRKAIQLDPRSPDAQDALGMMQARQAQWKQAEPSFRKAIELSPRDPLWRNHFAAFFLLPLGRIEEAIDQLRVAEGLDPHSPLTRSALGQALRAAGRFDQSEGNCQQAAQTDRDRSVCWADTLLRQGKNEQAIAILESVWSDHLLEPGAQDLGVAFARTGRRQDAERIAALVPRPASKLEIYAALKDKDRAFAILDQMVPMGPTRIGRDFLISPKFGFLGGDPRLTALRKKVGLPD